jgi:hypothetical protein
VAGAVAAVPVIIAHRPGKHHRRRVLRVKG